MLFVKWPGVNWGPLSWARKVFDTTHYERNNFGEKVSQRSWTSWKKNPTSYLFFLISSQSEIRRKLTSFVIWPQLPIFQLKSLLRRGRKTCPKKWNEMAIFRRQNRCCKSIHNILNLPKMSKKSILRRHFHIWIFAQKIQNWISQSSSLTRIFGQKNVL